MLLFSRLLHFVGFHRLHNSIKSVPLQWYSQSGLNAIQFNKNSWCTLLHSSTFIYHFLLNLLRSALLSVLGFGNWSKIYASHEKRERKTMNIWEIQLCVLKLSLPKLFQHYFTWCLFYLNKFLIGFAPRTSFLYIFCHNVCIRLNQFSSCISSKVLNNKWINKLIKIILSELN